MLASVQRTRLAGARALSRATEASPRVRVLTVWRETQGVEHLYAASLRSLARRVPREREPRVSRAVSPRGWLVLTLIRVDKVKPVRATREGLARPHAGHEPPGDASRRAARHGLETCRAPRTRETAAGVALLLDQHHVG